MIPFVLTEHAWRQGSDNWSSTGSSRPSSGAGPGGSTPDFQQLSLGGRRAAFRTQKWSHSFDQSSASPGVISRRHHQPLSLDSGYPGSPSSGLASYQSQTWTETNTASTSTNSTNSTNSTTTNNNNNVPNIESAKRELAGLMKDNVSLPSFPDIFQAPPDCLQSTHFYSYPACHEGIGTQEDLDELDKEITEIVEQATASGGVLRQISEESVCLKPRPIRTSTIKFSPTASPDRDRLMVAVISTAEHSFSRSAGETEEQESHFYSSSVTTSTNLFPESSVSASPPSPALPLVVSQTPASQPAGFKRTAQFSSESYFTFLLGLLFYLRCIGTSCE